MLVDVLKRYLLIVWNFFFGQISSESIKDSPSCLNDQPTDSTNVDSPIEIDDDVNIANEDEDSEEIFDDEVEDEEDEDEDEEIIVPKKQEDKIIINDIPKKPEVKVPEVPKIKDNNEINKKELPKVDDDENKEKQKPKAKSDETEKKDIEVKKAETPKLKPELEFIENEASHLSNKDKDKLKSEFEIIEKEATVDVVPEKEPAKLLSEEKELPKVTLEKKDSPNLPPKTTTTHVSFKDDVEKPPSTDEKKQDAIQVPPKIEDHPKRTGTESVVSAGTKVLPDIDDKVSQRENNANFVVLEKDEATTTGKVDGLKKTDGPIDSFLLGEQLHSSHAPQSESIQDQQLDYSDSGEELSDDDIEIDYEDDEDEDEEVEEVKPLPPVARSVYKKND